MALHDVDKGNDDRGNPVPNRPDVVAEDATMAHRTISTQYRTGADATGGQVQMTNKQFIANDGTAPKALFGYHQGLNKWGFFVATDGVDVTQNTDLSKFIFNSGQDTFKIVKSGAGTFPALTVTAAAGAWASNISQVTIPHNLGYIPAILVYISSSSQYSPLPFTISGPTGSGTTQYFVNYAASADATNLYATIQVSSYGGSGGNASALPFKYFLLQETAN